ncbi:SDR family NAD(P)-dependent oxidoreductase [Microbulbifer spongiae]|uniref:SDR family NAD(P)-dependent oxidoreductase n=1 Tax=Microbulbifer spongiae TaxID=2944933 RepID=A0ABY9E9V3_9GAMM|nr:SDR family NAD(P)-dependent oxidoreductase [Microbulbifer sp. MI-G]WKD49800.1 SDR family NAD(P)-dependent oxidoreductase [Microbulbifer sp. MI-G]
MSINSSKHGIPATNLGDRDMSQKDSENKGRLRVVVMTGATAGIGANALRRIASSNCRIIVGTRGASPEFGESLPLDLSSLESVWAFAGMVRETLESESIDALVLNAGTAFSNTTQATKDGFEVTFAVNHLAHYLLARLLLPKMSHRGRLIITTSDVHAQAPKPLDIGLWSSSRADGSGMRAYAASKLCNLLTARSLVIQDLVKEKECQIIAYNPGLTVGTSLSRHSAKWQRLLMNSALLHAFLRLGSNFIPMMYPGSPERAGEALADLTLGYVTPPEGQVYASLVRGDLTYPDPSELASDDKARDKLWQESGKMVGLPTT